MIPPSWSLIKWLYRKLDWNFSIDSYPAFEVFPTGSTTAFGPYAGSYIMVNHYAFGGDSAARAFRSLALHLGFGADKACSAAARVSSSLPISGLPFVLG